MERLTKPELVNGIPVCYPNNCSGLPEFMTKGNPYRNIVERLKAYEDLEEQGKLLKLPCAVGDTVYQHMIIGVDKDKRKPIYKIFEAKVFKFSLSSCGLCFWTETVDKGKHQNEVPLSAFNETVFLTKSGAEQALKEMEGKK